jgi:hypothetical protein
VLAASIISARAVGLSTSQSQAVISGLAQAGYLAVSNNAAGGTTLDPATLAVVVIPSGAQTTGTNWGLIAVAKQLQSAGDGTVMAGGTGAIGAGSAITLEGGSGQFSTVDDADTVEGEIMVAQALGLLLDGKAPAQYGVAPGAAPSPAPTPSPTPTSTPSTSPPSGKQK